MKVKTVTKPPVLYPDIEIHLSGTEVGLFLRLFGALRLDASVDKLTTEIPFYPEGKEIREMTNNLYNLMKAELK